MILKDFTLGGKSFYPCHGQLFSIFYKQCLNAVLNYGLIRTSQQNKQINRLPSCVSCLVSKKGVAIKVSQSLTDKLVELLKEADSCPSAWELSKLCTAIHAMQADYQAPELEFMKSSFEELADDLYIAGLKCLEEEINNALYLEEELERNKK